MTPQLGRPEKLRLSFRRRIVRQYFVRFHMGLMVTASVATALVSSKLLLELGLTSVLLRYPLCVLAGYLGFIAMVKLWTTYILMSYSRPLFGRLPDVFDALDVGSSSHSSSAGGSRFTGFHGGDSGGGGASDSWSPSLPSLDLDVDADDGIWLILALVAVIAAIFGAGAYVIYVAPQMLPDIALNALLAPALARAAKKAESGGWLEPLLRYTWMPLAVVLLLTLVLAVVVRHHCPGAAKLMEALTCPTTP